MYIKKDGKTLVVGMPRLANWAESLAIKDEKRLALVKQLDKEIPEIMVSLGAKEVANVNPLKAIAEKPTAKDTPKEEKPEKVATKKSEQGVDEEATDSVIIVIPEVPQPVKALKVVTKGGNAPVKENHSLYNTRSIVFKPSVPPKAVVLPLKKQASEAKVGEINNDRVSSYLRGKLQSVDAVKKSLVDAGFAILSATTVDKKANSPL